jgi:membrane protease YdiL (CAAX protease family)
VPSCALVDPLPDVAPPAPVGRKSALAFFAVLLALWFPGALAQAVSLPLGLAWTEVFVFLLSAFVAAAGSNLRVVPYLRLRPAAPAALALGALCGAAGYVFAGAILMLTERLVPAELVRAFDPVRLFEGTPGERLALAAVATLLAPPCEELAFRGYVQTTLGLRRRPLAAVLAAAALFALLHMNPVLFPALVVLGAVFGWLVWRAGSIWPAVLAHAVNNGITSWLVLSGEAPAPAGEAPPAAIAAALVIGGGGLLVVGVLYRAVAGFTPADGAVVLRDPADPSIRFSPSRVPRGLAAAALLGAALLAALLGAGLLGVRPPRS